MFQKIDKKLIKEITYALEFYDLWGYFPWEKKKVLITIPYDKYLQLKQKGISKTIQQYLN